MRILIAFLLLLHPFLNESIIIIKNEKEIVFYDDDAPLADRSSQSTGGCY